ncbi:MAG: sodium:proton antiporter, partial [Rhodococcus sp. (in: high G+C Gram-positive bacteria)]|nr:sodium:proton antiporter [Rhodococcus sp. (in: high G+C Gram-positive bacteria)]
MVVPGSSAAPRGGIVTWALQAIAGILLVFAAISGRVAGTSVTAPMVFTVGGLVLGAQAAG